MRIYSIVLLTVLLISCGSSQEELANGDDPIAALGSTVSSSRYALNYWVEQRDQETATWSAAAAYCEPAERANYPNCETVREVGASRSGKVVDPRTQPGFGDF